MGYWCRRYWHHLATASLTITSSHCYTRMSHIIFASRYHTFCTTRRIPPQDKAPAHYTRIPHSIRTTHTLYKAITHYTKPPHILRSWRIVHTTHPSLHMGAARYMHFILRVARARNALTGDNAHINTCEAAVIQKGWAGVFVLLVLMCLFCFVFFV